MEEDAVYETVYDQVVDIELAEKERSLIRQDREGGVNQYIRHLSYVLEKPTPVTVKEKTYLTELSILKQCLLFNDIKASVIIYKLARLVPHIDYEDYFMT